MIKENPAQSSGKITFLSEKIERSEKTSAERNPALRELITTSFSSEIHLYKEIAQRRDNFLKAQKNKRTAN